MKTRMIEYKGCRYSGVEEVALRSRNGASLLFDAKAGFQVKGGVSSGADMLDTRQSGQAANRTLRIDVERRDIFRIRYAEGDTVPENDTEMVVADFIGAAYSLTEDDDAYYIDTGAYRMRVGKRPYSLRVYDASGNRKFAASLGESNDFKPLDAFNLGVVRGAARRSSRLCPQSRNLRGARTIRMSRLPWNRSN